MLLDCDGFEIERRKQYGYLRGPVEYSRVEAAANDIDVADCIGSEWVEADEYEGE